MKYKCYPNYR